MPGMVPDDVYALTGATDPRVSPDGRTVAYVVWSIDKDANEYRSAIWLAPIDGSAPPRQFTSGTTRDAAPRWSPDGERIAFASPRHEDWDIDHISDIHVIDVSGRGEPRQVSLGDGTCDAPSWSPDGASIAYLFAPGVFDDPRHGQVAVSPAEGGDRKVLTTSLDRQCAPYPVIREQIWDGADLMFAAEDRGSGH